MREFSSNRLYKLIRAIVLIISTIALLTAVIKTKNFDSYQSSELELSNKVCNGSSSIGCRWVFIDSVRSFQDSIYLSYAIGILLPALFFGATWVIDYIFPKGKITS